MTVVTEPGQDAAARLFRLGRPPARLPPPGRSGRWLRLLAHLVLRPALAVLVLGVLAALGLALRLSVGPIDVTWLVHAVTPLQLGGDRHAQPVRPPQGQLEVGRAQLAWQGFREGSSAPLVIKLADVAIRRPNGTIVDHLDRIRISLLPGELLRGQLSIVEVGVSGARLNLRRDQVGGLDLGLVPVRQQSIGGSSGPQLQWDALKRVHVADMQIAVHDLVAGRDWVIRDVDINVRPPLAGRHAAALGDADRGGIVGRFGATLLLAGRHVVLRGDGSALAAMTPGEVIWHVTLDPVVPAELAASLQGVGPDLSPLRIAALPVSPMLDVTFANGPGQFMEPRRAEFSVTLGRGEIRIDPVLRVEGGAFQLQASLSDDLQQAVTLRLLQADLQLRDAADLDTAAATGPVLHAEGTLSTDQLSDPRRIRASLSADIPRIGFAGLSQYWPNGAAIGARRWITTNMTAGEARGLHVEDTLASETGWDGLAETGRTGGFDASGLTLWWLRPIAPLHDMQARLTFQGPDAVLIEAPHAVMPVDGGHPGAGRAGGGPRVIDVSNGSMRITGLEATQQIGTVAARLTGDLDDLLTELGNPRLRLLSRHPVPFTHPSGHAVTDFTLALPLDDNVSIDALTVSARARMTDVHLGDVAAGRALDHARLSVSATTAGLTVAGTGDVGTIPAAFDYAMDFRGGSPDQVIEQAHVVANVTTGALRREGLDPSDDVAGSGRLSVAYAAHRSGASTVGLGLDLTDLAIATQVWSKARGQPAEAAAVIGLQHGRLASIDHIHATGPGLAFDARAAIVGGRARKVVVGHFVLGRSSGTGRIDLPVDAVRGQPPAPIMVQVRGPALDLAPAISGSRRRLPAPADRPRTRRTPPATPQPWVADLGFDRVYVSQDSVLTDVSAHVEDDGTRIRLARLESAGPTPVSVLVTPQQGGRHVTASAGDSGRLLQALGVTGALSGGALHLDAAIDEGRGGTTVQGRVDIGRFVVLDAPLAARIARNLTIYGWLTALPTPQLGVDHLVAPFTLNDDVVTLSDARAHNAALGVTLQGPIDLGHRTLDLKGTVVPAWAINQLPGRLPLIGRLFSPETGGGVVAATISIHGPFAAPDVHVNALSALAPGFLRRLLFE